MSALRLSRSVFVDPWTRMEVTPAPLPVVEPSPVIRRKATPEELARLDGPDTRIVDAIGLVPRPIRGRLTDREKRVRREGPDAWVVVETLRACAGNVSAAAALLNIPQSSLHRRVRDMRADLPADVEAMLGRGVPRRHA